MYDNAQNYSIDIQNKSKHIGYMRPIIKSDAAGTRRNEPGNMKERGCKINILLLQVSVCNEARFSKK